MVAVGVVVGVAVVVAVGVVVGVAVGVAVVVVVGVAVAVVVGVAVAVAMRQNADALEGRTIEEVFGADPERLIGKTITGVKIEGAYGRVKSLRLALDGSRVTITYWAIHADDASLEMDLEEA